MKLNDNDNTNQTIYSFHYGDIIRDKDLPNKLRLIGGTTCDTDNNKYYLCLRLCGAMLDVVYLPLDQQIHYEIVGHNYNLAENVRRVNNDLIESFTRALPEGFNTIAIENRADLISSAFLNTFPTPKSEIIQGEGN